MKQNFIKIFVLTTVILLITLSAIAQPGNSELLKAINKSETAFKKLNHRLDVLQKKIDDIYWYNKIGDLAYIDKVYMTGPPLKKEKNPTAQGAGNPVKFW